MIDLSVSAADDEQGMTLGELRDALDRCLDAGADENGPVGAHVSRLHRVRRVEVQFEQPAPSTPNGHAPQPGDAP
jgi:hypothetical protein